MTINDSTPEDRCPWIIIYSHGLIPRCDKTTARSHEGRRMLIPSQPLVWLAGDRCKFNVLIDNLQAGLRHA